MILSNHAVSNYVTKDNNTHRNDKVKGSIALSKRQTSLLSSYYPNGIQFNYTDIKEFQKREANLVHAPPELGETACKPPPSDSATGTVSNKKTDTGKHKVAPNPMAKPVTNENVVKILNERLDKKKTEDPDLSSAADAIDGILDEQTKQYLSILMCNLKRGGVKKPVKAVLKAIAEQFKTFE